MPASIKLQQQYGDDIQVIFVESQQYDAGDAVEAFAWRSKWMGTPAMWTEEPPLQSSGSGLPSCALLDIDGKLLLEGNPLALKKQIETAIAEQVKKAKAGPEDASAEVKKAWAMFAKGDIAGALAQCDKAASDEAKAAKDELLARTRGRIARAQWLIDNGYIAEATKLLAQLEKATKADAVVSGEVAAQTLRLLEPALEKEREAGSALANLTEKMVKDKPFEPGNIKKLENLAEKFAGTKAGERAAHLAQIAKLAPNNK